MRQIQIKRQETMLETKKTSSLWKSHVLNSNVWIFLTMNLERIWKDWNHVFVEKNVIDLSVNITCLLSSICITWILLFNFQISLIRSCWATMKINDLNYVFYQMFVFVVYRISLDFKRAWNFFRSRTYDERWIFILTI